MAIDASFSVNTTTGYVRATTFQFTDTSSPSADVVFRSWDFGDYTVSSETSPTHVYTLPGKYVVTLKAYDVNYNEVVAQHTITVEQYVKDSLQFTDVPPPSETSQKNKHPFKLVLSATNLDEHYIDLYAEGSQSSSYKDPTAYKWSHLIPQWRFEDVSGNVITTIKTDDRVIYLSGEPVGTVGEAEFYYIDDLPTLDPNYGGQPVILWATLQTSSVNFPQDQDGNAPGYANSTVQAVVPYQINPLRPKTLEITENGNYNIFPLKWQYAKVPYIVTIHNNIFENSKPLFNFPSSNTESITTTIVTATTALSAIDADGEPSVFIGLVGDSGYSDESTDSVETLIKGHNVNDVILLGDNNYETGEASTIDANIGAHWRKYIYPFNPVDITDAPLRDGEEDATENHLWPIPGNHDWGNFVPNPTGLTPYLDYFSHLPNNQRYYKKSFDNIDIFFLDSDLNEPDGTTVGSVQYNWLVAELAASTAKFKGVVLHHTPYSSGDHHGSTSRMRWGFAALGVHFVIAGHEHNYERQVVDGVPYFTVGTGGPNLYGFIATPPARSESRYEGNGALFIQGYNDKVVLLFKTVSGEMIDSYTISYSSSTSSYSNSAVGTLFDGISSVTLWSYTTSYNTEYIRTPNEYSITVNGDTATLSNYDEIDLNSGGFRKGLTTFETTSLVEYITASMPVSIDAQSKLYRETPYAWVSNPENGTINRLSFTSEIPEQLKRYIRNAPPSAKVDIYPATTTKVVDSTTAEVPAFHGIYGIAATPQHDVWAADGEQDRLFKFDSVGNQISSIPLSGSPASIVIDGEQNIWVTLMDAPSAVKLSSLGVFITAVAPPATFLPYLRDRLPTAIEVDTSNSVWVAWSLPGDDHYGMPHDNTLCRYTSAGVLNTTAGTWSEQVISDIVCDPKDNSIWVTSSNSASGTTGKIQKFTSTGTLVSSFNNYASPTYITVDPQRGIWFTYGYHNVGHIDYFGNQSSLILSASDVQGVRVPGAIYGETIGYEYDGFGNVVSSFPVTAYHYDETDYPGWFNPELRIDEQTLEGIACDSRGRIWVVNSLENTVYAMSGTNVSTFKIYPDNNVGWKEEPNNIVTTDNNEWRRSAQALGDWTGYRWIQKYMPYDTTLSSISSYSVTGRSNPFEVREFKNNHEISRFDEDFDLGEHVKGLMLPEHLKANPALFDFIKTAVGDVGQVAYEKISNFAENHSDIDKCGVDQLYSIAEQLDVPIDDYKFTYPSEVKRLLDITSIKHSVLWGARSKEQKNFRRTQNTTATATNLGAELETATYMITAGTDIVAYHMFADTFEVINTVPQSGINVYPLSSLDGYGLQLPLEDNYAFYAFIPGFDNTQIEGVINWDSDATTILETASSLDEWYADNGIVEQMFNYMLHKGLGLIEE